MKQVFASITLILVLAYAAAAQTEQVLYNFNGSDGSQPFGLIADGKGNFFGVATDNAGSVTCCGTVFELSQVAGKWKAIVLHHFLGGADGANPIGSLAFDAHGNLFGVTQSGGAISGLCRNNCGTVFELSPKPGGGWNYSRIYSFRGDRAGDGSDPDAGLRVDSAGNLYGTTWGGGVMPNPPFCGNYGCGTVFELSPSSTGWTESVLYRFNGGEDGAYPRSPLLFDARGNLIGATSQGGGGHCNLGGNQLGCGTIFELSPSSGTWVETVLHRFQVGEGEIPYQGLLFDAAGNLFGTTNLGGAGLVGAVYELSQGSGGAWQETTLFDFPANADGIWPAGGLTMDTTGALYGTASSAGGSDAGTLFKLTPSSSGSFSFTLFKTFNGTSDGAFPSGSLVVDSAGSVYGTTEFGGANGYGLVYKLVP